MALMRFREENRVKWVGVRPAHDGTFHSEHLAQAVVAWGNVYTVGAGQTLYLTHTFLTGRSAAVSGWFAMRITVGAADHYIYRIGISANADTETGLATSHYFPIEVLTTDTVDIYVSALGIVAYGGFNGFLVNN